MTGVGLGLTVGRYIIRKRTLGHLEWDDLAHGLGVCMLIGYASTYTASFRRDYEVTFWAADQGPTPSEETLGLYIRSIVAVTLQFWVCIYFIKLSFLLFYRRLFGVSRNFMKAWWAVATLWSCDTPGQLFIPGKSLI